MAFDFIKKAFTFGKSTGDTKPTEVIDAAITAPVRPEKPPAPDIPKAALPEQPASPAMGLPHDGGDMHFTPETAGNGSLSTPPPMDEEHSGEPPIGDSDPDTGPDTGRQPPTLADIQADPAIEKSAATEAFEIETTTKSGEIPADVKSAQERAPRTVHGRVEVAGTVRPAVLKEAEPSTVKLTEEIGWWQRLRRGLSRSSAQLTEQVSGIFTRRKLDEETLQELEDVLIQADLGLETAIRITDRLASGRFGKDISPAEVGTVMAAEIEKVLDPVALPLELDLSHKPHVILVVGVNGTGKTTTIGKLAAKLTEGGLRVMLAAGDTFRAAAIEQLRIWGERTGSKVISTRLGADAAGLAYEAFEAARSEKADVLIIDTAGRLQNRTELMDELAKIVRVIGKLDSEAPHTVLQTLDATTGQNALNQVEMFRNVAGVNGLVMTKLDGTARGGILIAIAARHKLPVYFVGVGEGVDDLEPFKAKDFAAAIAGVAP